MAQGCEGNRLSYKIFSKEVPQFVKAVLLLPGSASQEIKAHWNKKKPNILLVKNISVAVKKAATLAEEGDTVLLSPGATSFNQFQHEFKRGEAFARSVNDLR